MPKLIEEPKEPMLVITVKAADVKIDRIPSYGRRHRGYNLFLGKCLPKKPDDVGVPEFLGVCSGLWKDIPEDEKAEYQELAEIENQKSRIEEESEESK